VGNYPKYKAKKSLDIAPEAPYYGNMAEVKSPFSVPSQLRLGWVVYTWRCQHCGRSRYVGCSSDYGRPYRRSSSDCDVVTIPFKTYWMAKATERYHTGHRARRCCARGGVA